MIASRLTLVSSVLAVLAVLAGPACAQALPEDFLITGKDVAGKARVMPVSPQETSNAVWVSLTFRAFGHGDGEERTIQGEGTRTADGLRFTFSTEVSVPRDGLVDWIQDPYLRRPEPRRYTTETTAVFRQRGETLRGLIAGTEQVWTPAPDLGDEDLVVLMVPGLSTNYWNRMGLPYFDENRDALRALGLEVRRIGTHADGSVNPGGPFKTENSVAQNARVIADEVLAEAARGKRVILFAHSKGGTDSTAAVGLHPEILPHVAGLIAIQPVYGGSPVADLAGGHWLTTGGVQLAFEVWAGGSRDAVLDLTRDRREAFVAAHPFPTDRIPTVVIRSSFDRSKAKIGRTARGERLKNPGKRFFQRVLRANQGLIEVLQQDESDGMVTLADQRIPGATHIDKDDLDHFEPGLEMISRHAPANLTTEAALALFDRLAARD
jgi:hypothetical protein